MYEAAQRIDVGEMVNSRFHQAQPSLRVSTVTCLFCLFYGVVTSEHLGQKASRVKNVGVFRLLGACLFPVR